jgi:hypothetical protein
MMKLYQIQRQAGIGILGTERDVREYFPEPSAQAALDLFFKHARPGDVFDGLYRDDLDERGEPLMFVDGIAFVVALGRRFTPRLQISAEKVGEVRFRTSVSLHAAHQALLDTGGDIEDAVASLMRAGYA